MNTFNLLVGFILITVGIGSLLGINIWNIIWPLILIFIGLNILLRKSSTVGWNSKSSKIETEDFFDYSLIFNGVNEKIVSKNFKGGEFNAIFGGGELDLTDCKIPEGKSATIKISVIFGGVKLVVPKNWQINTHITQIAGGFDNKARQTEEIKGKLIIEGSAIFGGGEIING